MVDPYYVNHSNCSYIVIWFAFLHISFFFSKKLQPHVHPKFPKTWSTPQMVKSNTVKTTTICNCENHLNQTFMKFCSMLIFKCTLPETSKSGLLNTPKRARIVFQASFFRCQNLHPSKWFPQKSMIRSFGEPTSWNDPNHLGLLENFSSTKLLPFRARSSFTSLKIFLWNLMITCISIWIWMIDSWIYSNDPMARIPPNNTTISPQKQ